MVTSSSEVKFRTEGLDFRTMLWAVTMGMGAGLRGGENAGMSNAMG